MSTSNSTAPGDFPSEPHSRKSLVKSTGILSLGIFTSRLLGFVRDMVLAQVLGTGVRADAFFVAFKIPNMFRELVAEGASNAAIVPVLSEVRQKKTPAEFWSCVNVIFFWGTVILGVLTMIGMLLSPWLVRIMAPGFLNDPAKLSLTSQLTAIMFPYLLLIGLTAYGMGVLYTMRSFTIPAFSSAVANVALIGAAFAAWMFPDYAVYILAFGVLGGGLLQIALQSFGLSQYGFRREAPKNFFLEEAIRIKRLMIPRMFGSGVYQMTVLVDTFCASLAAIVGPGGIPAIYYANRLVQLPMGLFGIAMASAALPVLSSQSRGQENEFKKTLVFFLENILFLMVPITVLLALTAKPIIRGLFQRGAFDAYSTEITSSALMFYAFGLTAFAVVKMLVTAFYALQDTKTPVKIAALCLVLTAAANAVLMFPLKIGGIALANSIVATVNALILWICLRRKIGAFGQELKIYVCKIVLASSIAGFGVYLMWPLMPFEYDLVNFFLLAPLMFISYGGLCYLMKIDQIHHSLAFLKRKFQATGSGG